ncbi:hypothetical protein B0H11DRAFT_2161929 [Mycena galericulata]|nr:hypothetical protein B0H11DRAFT_2161929 [Mycena galericulata]
MASTRIVSVFGATGTQGAAVVKALLKDGTFAPRAIGRDPDSESARKLKASGIEFVKGDSSDKASLVSALRGSEAVFAGKNIIDAAKEAGVKFFIFTSLPSIKRISGGKYKNVLHYDQKEVVEEYLRSCGLANATLHLGGFLENYWKMGFLKKTATGFDVARPTSLYLGREVPAVTLALLKNYTDPSKKISGKVYPIVNATMPYAELAALTGKALGKEVTFTTAPPSGFAPMDEVFAAHAEFNGLFTATPVPNPDLVALGVKLGTIEEFLEAEVKPRFGQ